MNHKISRRESLKVLGISSITATTILVPGCDTPTAPEEHAHEHADSTQSELSPEDQKLMEQQFFTEHEMKTVRVLADLVIPADDKSGSASDAEVAEFIEFMMKDQPWHQTAMRGGLKWLDLHCLKQYEKNFVDCTQEQQIEVLDIIAYPEVAPPEMSQGVAFFNRFRDFVATGFFTSKIGIEDIGYQGNKANVWRGVPDEVLSKLGVDYSEWETLVEGTQA